MQVAHQATTSAGVVNYQAAEVQSQERTNLEKLRQLPYNPQELAEQFKHGINSHLPDGVATKVSAERYTKDEVSGLIVDHIPGVTEEQQTQLLKLLRERAPACVAYTLDDIEGYEGAEPPMQITLNTTQKIIIPPRRNWSAAESNIIDEKCQDLLAGARPTCTKLVESDYACNPVLAIKRAPDGTWSDKRFCINFIPINKHTELDMYKTLRADTMFDKVVRAKYLTALDLRSGFHQIPMHPDSISKTAFWWSTNTTAPQLLAYQRMPFGLKNAPAKFQRMMDVELALAGCTEFAFAYIDDLIIASDTWEEHLSHLEKVLDMLQRCRLRIHPEKSIFATNIVEYLGHNVVGQHGITMNEAKVVAIKALPDPQNVMELRSILGFLSYYRHFIPGFSALTAHLTKLLQKGVPYVWGPEQAAAYATLKDLMTTPGRVLRPIHPDRELILHTDWSLYGIGAVLGQKDDEGQEYLCACNSRSLNKHERNYPSYKGELLALAWAVRSFRHHLHGRKFRLITDHQPLTWLMKARDLNGQYARWQVLLQEYDFVIEHRPGIKHQNADVLSRFPQARTTDDTGAQLDVEYPEPEVVAVADSSSLSKTSAMCPCCGQRVLQPESTMASIPTHDRSTVRPGIDTFAPKFKDLFHRGNAYVDAAHYMDAAMRGEPPDGEFPEDQVVAAIQEAGQLAAKDLEVHVQRAQQAVMDQGQGPEFCSLPGRMLPNGVLGWSFFKDAGQDSLVLLELCGGICSVLEMLLKAGVRVHRYIYADNSIKARQAARFRVHNLSGKYPNLLPPSAWETAFDLPQDITQLKHAHLRPVLQQHQHQRWLVTAGADA